MEEKKIIFEDFSKSLDHLSFFVPSFGIKIPIEASSSQFSNPLSREPLLKGRRISTVELLNENDCFGKKDKNSFSIKCTRCELVSLRKSTVLYFHFSKDSLLYIYIYRERERERQREAERKRFS